MEIIHAYDIDTELIPALLARFGREVVERFDIGPKGNLLQVDVENMEDVDVIIAGPPCPPFSSIGSRGGLNDERAKVFGVVHNMLKDQYRRKALKAFIVEMVAGMSHERVVDSSTGPRDEKENLYQNWLQQLKEDLPGFRTFSWLMQTADYLPQHRPRLYTVGISVDVLGDRVMIPPTLPRTAMHMRATLSSALNTGLPALCEQNLTGQQRVNLMTMKRRLLAHRPRGRSMCCCISVDRDPGMVFGEYYRQDGCVCTLRTQNEMLWILMVDCAGVVTLSRCLHPVERLGLQGFSPELAKGLSKRALLRFTGNACSAPVITSVFRQLLCQLANPFVLGLPDVPRPLSIWTLREDTNQYLAKMRLLNNCRSVVAILEQLVRLEGRS